MWFQNSIAKGTIGIAVILAVATYTWRVVEIPLLSLDHGAALMFLFAVAAFVPFVVTYCRLGLALDEHEESDAKVAGEVARRRQLVSFHCPCWAKTWQITVIFVAVAFIAYTAFPNYVNPGYALSAAVCFVSGIWFEFVYSVVSTVLRGTTRE